MVGPAADVIRAKVDALRAAMQSASKGQLDVLSALTSGLPEEHGSAAQEEAHGSGSLHLCPWHTCAATRHGIVD